MERYIHIIHRRCLMGSADSTRAFCVCWLHFDLLLLPSTGTGAAVAATTTAATVVALRLFHILFIFFFRIFFHFFLSLRFYSRTKYSVEHSMVFQENRFQVVPMLFSLLLLLCISHLSELNVVVPCAQPLHSFTPYVVSRNTFNRLGYDQSVYVYALRYDVE